MFIFCSRRIASYSQSHGSRRDSADAADHDVIVCVTTNIVTFMREKEVENLINLYQTQTSFWDTKLQMTKLTSNDADKRLQALERIRNGLENKYIQLYSQGKLTVQRIGDCCGS